MKLNEKGSSLPIALLVIFVFTVLGLSVMGNVVGESKRVTVTESDVQARYLAENGLTYFVNSFNSYVSQTDPASVNVNTFLQGYQTFIPIDPNHKDETNIKAARDKDDPDIVNVTSIGKTGNTTKTLVGRYRLGFAPPEMMADFTGKAIDFSNDSLANIQLLGLADLDVLNPTGGQQTYYKVPYGIAIGVNVSLVVNLNIGSDPFEVMRDNEVVATRSGHLLGVGLIKDVVNLSLLNFKDEPDTNVLINGYYPPAIDILKLISTGPRYADITFRKLGVLGNTIIQQDRPNDSASLRSFTFVNGLYVNKDLVIGDAAGGTTSNLQLHGNMVTLGNLYINNVNLTTGNLSNKEAIYVAGDAEITNACINQKGGANSDFQLYANGKITFKVDGTSRCNNNTFNGFFYAEKGIEVQDAGKTTSDQAITINGGIVGQILTPNRIHYTPNLNYISNTKVTYNKLMPLGRTLE